MEFPQQINAEFSTLKYVIKPRSSEAESIQISHPKTFNMNWSCNILEYNKERPFNNLVPITDIQVIC